MKTLTVFTPTYNRAHTLGRLFESLCRQTCDDFEWIVIDDGSNDGTREWLEGLGTKTKGTGQRFDWMGRVADGEDDNHFVIHTKYFSIEYVYKPNGGLYTGYNVAYAAIETELCVCIDSDDYMPDDAVGKIVDFWQRHRSSRYAGILGLDYNITTQELIGGTFPEGLKEVYFYDLTLKGLHSGDTKPVMRTELMKEVAPQVGFVGEKNFNPVYMMLQVCDKYPILLLNENLCNVEYQIGTDSMSQGIWKQYVNSARSFAKLRLLEMGLKHNSLGNKIRVCIHYISSCMLSRENDWLKKSPLKAMTFMLFPLGFVMYMIVLWKNKK